MYIGGEGEEPLVNVDLFYIQFGGLYIYVQRKGGGLVNRVLFCLQANVVRSNLAGFFLCPICNAGLYIDVYWGEGGTAPGKREIILCPAICLAFNFRHISRSFPYWDMSCFIILGYLQKCFSFQKFMYPHTHLTPRLLQTSGNASNSNYFLTATFPPHPIHLRDTSRNASISNYFLNATFPPHPIHLRDTSRNASNSNDLLHAPCPPHSIHLRDTSKNASISNGLLQAPCPPHSIHLRITSKNASNSNVLLHAPCPPHPVSLKTRYPPHCPL